MNAPVKTPPVSFPEAFIALQAAIKPAIKDSTNPAFKSKYADFAAVWEAVKDPLHSNGFAITQLVQFEGETMYLETILLHATNGPSLKSQYPLRPTRADPQGFGSALTYAKRYALCAMLGVVADDDDDGAKASERPNISNAQRDAIHTPKTMGTETHPTQAPPHGEDADIVDGVNNWIAKQSAAIGLCNRLPELFQWQDEQEDALNRLLKKYPAGHRKIMDQFEARKKAIGKS